ncbi:MAG: carbohydrate ABC transporter permease [Clostridia bacterium]|nr:carbohydrate ABC transporter permease [Clostridia bacterium]
MSMRTAEIRERPLVRKKHTATNVILVILSVIWLVPIAFLIIASMKTKQEYNMSYIWDMPKSFGWAVNFKYLADYSTVLQSAWNSILYGLAGGFGCLVVASLAAYAIAKLNIRHRMFWFLFIYSGTIFPFQMYLIPVFKAYMNTGLYNTRPGLMLFYIAITVPFAMFVLHNQFRSISDEIVESAKIDGASKLRILLSIMLPMSKPSLIVVFMTQFSWCYNELMFGMTLVKSSGIRPVMATITGFSGNVPALLVGCIVVSVPTILLYLFLNRNFDTGIVYTSK